MSDWWARLVRWWTAVSETRVVGPGAPAISGPRLSELEHAYLEDVAALFEAAAQAAVASEATVAVHVRTAREIAERLRLIASGV